MCVIGAVRSAATSVRIHPISPWAEKTGNLTLIPNSVVHSITYDEKKGRATGVKVIDAKTKHT